MAEQPTGTVTLLFTDIEGSTALLQRLGTERYLVALDLHRQLLREGFEQHGGYEVDSEGDAFFVAFARAGDAVAAASTAQRALAGAEWPEGLPIRVRMGIHTGEPLAAPPKYVGLDVHKAARIMAVGHGGQVLVSAATQRLLDVNVSLRDLGQHRLKDLSQPEPLYQLAVSGLRTEFPALKTLGNRPNNLPVVATPFIGRERELVAVQDLLLQKDLRLLTLVGTGGIGKTRLALQAVAELSEHFDDGVFWVPLASVREGGLVAATVAQTLGLREEPGEPIADLLGRYLADRRLLLLLDNLEHVLDEARALAAQLLRSGVGVTVVATSREALRVGGEQVYEVPPLGLPDADEALVQNDAVALFVGRARAADASFSLDEQNSAVVASIVHRLEGLPLAIELAAARTRALPPRALLERLTDRLPLLSMGTYDADERQRTLRATLEWSYNLLAPLEQTLFGRLGAFVDGCRLDAAESVCDVDGDLGVDIVDGISSLLDKSLLRRRNDADGQPRYWMLETIREYAAEVLPAPDRAAAELRHLRYYVGRAVVAWDDALDASSDWFESCDSEIANFRAAVARAFAGERAEEALPLIVGWGHYLLARGRLSEGRSICEEALRRTIPTASPWRCWTLSCAGEFQRNLGDHSAAIPLKQEALDGFRTLALRPAVASALSDLGDMISLAGDIEGATVLAEEALEIRKRLGDPGGIGQAEAGLGGIKMLAGDYEGADELLRRALERVPPDSIWGASYSHTLGESLRRQRRYADATKPLLDSLSVANELGLEHVSAECLECLGAILAEADECIAAATCWGAAARIRDRTGAAPWLPIPQAAVERARAACGEEVFERARDDGRAMSANDATTYVREKLSDVPAIAKA